MAEINATARTVQVEVISDSDPLVVRDALNAWLVFTAGEKKLHGIDVVTTATEYTAFVYYSQ